MKIIKILDERMRSIAGKIIMGLLLASLAGGLSVLPAFGEDFRRHDPRDRGRYERRDRDRYERRARDDYYRRRVYRHHYDRRPVYAPPPIIVEPPPPPPGIHIFFPPIIIR
ncbi:MAG: hypothetical protein HY787_22965 [Deltaproteobacteria bacterium]|nr:hypothetical protein [Deltaproteobacteria bacterium]